MSVNSTGPFLLDVMIWIFYFKLSISDLDVTFSSLPLRWLIEFRWIYSQYALTYIRFSTIDTWSPSLQHFFSMLLSVLMPEMRETMAVLLSQRKIWAICPSLLIFYTWLHRCSFYFVIIGLSVRPILSITLQQN